MLFYASCAINLLLYILQCASAKRQSCIFFVIVIVEILIVGGKQSQQTKFAVVIVKNCYINFILANAYAETGEVYIYGFNEKFVVLIINNVK